MQIKLFEKRDQVFFILLESNTSKSNNYLYVVLYMKMAILTHCHPSIHLDIQLLNTNGSSTMLTAEDKKVSKNNLPGISQNLVSNYTYDMCNEVKSTRYYKEIYFLKKMTFKLAPEDYQELASQVGGVGACVCMFSF